MIKFGPAGNDEKFFEDGNKTLLDAPKWIKSRGLDLYEISFGHGIIVNENYAIKLSQILKENDLEVSIHAPYYINFANPDKEMIEKSFNYVINSLKILKILGGKILVIHSGTQLKLDRETALNNVKTNYKELIRRIYDEKLDDLYISPETMGKFSQIGNVDEIIDICKLDKILLPTFDFGHINSYTKGGLKTKNDYETIIKKCFKELGEEKTKNMHIHFSKIQYGEKGEIKHLTFEDNIYGPDYKALIDVLIENDISATLICESSGTMALDAITMKNYYKHKIQSNSITANLLRANMPIIFNDKVYMCKKVQKIKDSVIFKIITTMYDYETNEEYEKLFEENDIVSIAYCESRNISFIRCENEIAYFEYVGKEYILHSKLLTESLIYLKNDSICIGQFYNDNLIYVLPNNIVNLKVEQVERKKNSWEITNSKNVMLETGIWLNVPLEVQKNDIVSIDTKQNKYMSTQKEKI